MIKTGKSLSNQYELLKSFLAHLRSQCVRHRDQTRDIKTTVDELLPLLREADSRLSTVPAGLVAWAQQQESDQAYDVAAELAATRTAVQSSIAWIIANVPKDPVTGTVNERILNPDGTVTNIEVTPEKALEAVAQVQTVIDTISE